MPTREGILRNIISHGFGISLITLDEEHARAQEHPVVREMARNSRTGDFAPGEEKALTGIAQAIRELRVEMVDGKPKLRNGITLTEIEISMAEMERKNPTLRSTMENWAASPNVTTAEIRAITLKAYENRNSTNLVNDLKSDMDRMAGITPPNLPANPVTPPPISNPSTAAGTEPIAPPPPQGPPQSPAQEERYVLPEVLNQGAFNTIRGSSLLLAAAVFPPDENRNSPVANDLATFRTLTESESFYTAFKNRYDNDPAMRATYQRLMDMIAENAAENEGGEMEPRARRALEPLVGEMLRDGNKLHNAEFLGRVDNLIETANNPFMGFIGMIIDAVKGFFGSFLSGLGITGPDVLNRMGSDGINMIMDGARQLPFVGGLVDRIAGNAGGENIRGLERSLREADLGQHYNVVRNAEGAPQEYVFVDVRTRDDKGTGFMIRPRGNEDLDGLRRRNEMYFDSMDREGRGDNERSYREGWVAIPKEIYDQVKNNPEQLQARITEAETIRQRDAERIRELETAEAERARQAAERARQQQQPPAGGATPSGAMANGMAAPSGN